MELPIIIIASISAYKAAQFSLGQQAQRAIVPRGHRLQPEQDPDPDPHGQEEEARLKEGAAGATPEPA